MESVTETLFEELHSLVETPFFKFFRVRGPALVHPMRFNDELDIQVDLYRECPYWQENGFCMNRECAITTVDEVCITLRELANPYSIADLVTE